jgi:hypothetical protein
MKPKIQDMAFGSITIGDKVYKHDIVIELNGKVRKRKKKLSKRLFGTSHKVSLDEIKDVYEKGARQLIVGAGQYDQLRLSKEAQAHLASHKCDSILLSTPEAMEKWNETKGQGKTIGLFHVTC